MNKLMIQAKADAVPSKLSFTAPITLTAAAGEGKLPTFKMVAYTGGVMNLSGFYSPVIVDLSGVKASNASIAILRDHDPGRVVGHTSKVEIGKQIDVEGTVSGAGADAQEVAQASKNGFPWQASIGASPDRIEILAEGKTAVVNGIAVTGPLNIVRASTLYEVSFVAIGADTNTSASVAANFSKENGMNFTEWLKAKGWEEATLSDEQRKVLKASFDAEQLQASGGVSANGSAKPVNAGNDGAAEGEDPAQAVIKATRAAVAQENKRLAKVQKLCAGHPDIAAKAIEEGWDETKTELEVLRASRPQAPGAIVRSSESTPAILTAAACLAGRMDRVSLEKQFDAKTLEAADRRFGNRIGLQELILEAAWANGYASPTMRHDMRGALKAAFSTHSLTTILTSVANKFLLDGFNFVEQSWRQIASIRPVNDFKTVTSYRMNADATFQEIGAGGELKHGSLSQESYTNQAKTYGRMMGISREDITNDDLGALTAVPQKLGRGGALGFNTVFWAKWLADTAFFKTDDSNKNYISGSTTNLSVAGLDAAVQKFMAQVDGESNKLGATPRILLVPPTLDVTAATLMKSAEIRDNTANSKTPTINPFTGRFMQVTSLYLTNATAWYLLADPRDISAIEVVFLNGRDQPTIETAEADFDQLGIQMRGYFDFGVALQDPRAGVKSKGAA